MYNIDEIKVQNQYDCWCLMYLSVARSIMDVCGRAGEGVIREAVRRSGASRGLAMRKRLEAAGLKPNLSRLLALGEDFAVDPRFRANILRQDEQVALWEVYTCPFADLAKERGERDLAHFYCEECYHAYLAAFTSKKGQTNLSKKLTHRGDNHCRFAAYYRPANLAPEARAAVFPEFDEGYKAPAASAAALLDAKAATKRLFLDLYRRLLEVAVERFGAEGSCAVALGLRELAPELARAMRLHADATGTVANEAFLELNFPLELDSGKEAYWKDDEARDAKEFLDINFLCIFKGELAL